TASLMGGCGFKDSVAIDRDGDRVVRVQPYVPCGGSRKIAGNVPPVDRSRARIVQRESAGENSIVSRHVDHSSRSVSGNAMDLSRLKRAGYFVPKLAAIYRSKQMSARRRKSGVGAFTVDPDPRDVRGGDLRRLKPGCAAVVRRQQPSVSRTRIRRCTG